MTQSKMVTHSLFEEKKKEEADVFLFLWAEEKQKKILPRIAIT